MMSKIDRYIFRITFYAFFLCLLVLTSMIWMTQVLREIDLITNQNQTILQFFRITSLAIPFLVLVISPVALLIAVLFSLNKLNGDSELVVLSASSMSPWRIFRPYGLIAILVSMLVAYIGSYLAPRMHRELEHERQRVRADMIANFVTPGTFVALERGLTFHVRERIADQYRGVLISDERQADEHVAILADEGTIVENEHGTFMLLTDGSVQKSQADRNPAIVRFDQYAFDLTRAPATVQNVTGLHALYLWDLAFPNPDEPLLRTVPAEFRVELHDRIIATLYPLAFAVLAFLGLGFPRTTRQSVTTAVIAVCVGAGALRLLGFAGIVAAVRVPIFLGFVYVAVLATIAMGAWAIVKGRTIQLNLRQPTGLAPAFAKLASRL